MRKSVPFAAAAGLNLAVLMTRYPIGQVFALMTALVSAEVVRRLNLLADGALLADYEVDLL